MRRRCACSRVIGAAVVICVGIAVWARIGPLPPGLLDDATAISTLVVDRHGVPLYEALSGMRHGAFG